VVGFAQKENRGETVAACGVGVPAAGAVINKRVGEIVDG
jgi:hypothetical protein